MQKNRAGIYLTLASAISLLTAAVLCCGYFGYLSPTVGFPRKASASYQRSISLDLGHGHSPARFTHPGLNFIWRANFSRPDWKRSLWEFDAFHIYAGWGSDYLLAFPIWCGLLACSIAPVIWSRKRPRKQVGFAVIKR
jgi:hypothetical protein